MKNLEDNKKMASDPSPKYKQEKFSFYYDIDSLQETQEEMEYDEEFLELSDDAIIDDSEEQKD